KGSTAFVQAPYSKGIHFLRAYTDEMLNISDNFIPCTPLYINAVEEEFAPFPNKQIQVYPEGGVLVANHEQRVVISAPNYIGDSVFVYNKAKKLQTESIISEYGNTMIMLTPDKNENYTIQIQDKEIPLHVTSYARTLQLTHKQNKVIYSVLSDVAIPKASKIKLNVYAGKELIHSVDIDDTNNNGYFDVSKLPNTLLSFILTQDDTVRVSQRALFTDDIKKVSQDLIDKKQLKNNLIEVKSASNQIDPEQSYRIYINCFNPLLSDLLPATAKRTTQIEDCFNEQQSAAKRQFVLDLQMIQLSDELAKNYDEVYPRGYSNKLRGKVKKEVLGSVNEGKIIAINADNKALSETSLADGGVFDIDLGAFADSTSFYLQAYNKKGKSNFFVIEIDSIYKPDFLPTHGKLKQKLEVFHARENIKDIAFEDVIPEIKVSARRKVKPIEASVYYDGRSFNVEQIQKYGYTALEQIVDALSNVKVCTFIDDAGFEIKEVRNIRTPSIISKNYKHVVGILLDNTFITFQEAINILDVNDIDKIEYIPAVRAVIYGAEAFNGLVKIETKSGWTTQEVPSQGLKFYPKGFSERTERASWHKPDNQCIVVTGQELIEGTTIAAANMINLILIEGFDKTGKMIQQRITLSD
ncbi:MAG: TonB-dependent receptor, partial [Tannerellaceae bacterium]